MKTGESLRLLSHVTFCSSETDPAGWIVGFCVCVCVLLYKCLTWRSHCNHDLVTNLWPWSGGKQTLMILLEFSKLCRDQIKHQHHQHLLRVSSSCRIACKAHTGGWEGKNPQLVSNSLTHLPSFICRLRCVTLFNPVRPTLEPSVSCREPSVQSQNHTELLRLVRGCLWFTVTHLQHTRYLSTFWVSDWLW